MKVDLIMVGVMVEMIDEGLEKLQRHDEFGRGFIAGQISSLEALKLIDNVAATGYKKRLYNLK